MSVEPGGEQDGSGDILAPVLDALDVVVAGLDSRVVDLDFEGDSEPALSALDTLAAVGRADDVISLLRAGTGATVVGALARTLLEQALAARWIADDPGARKGARTASLANERQRVAARVGEATGLTLPTLPRFLRPLGTSSLGAASGNQCLPDVQQDLGARTKDAAAEVMGAPAAVAGLLSMCGHANYAAAITSVGPPPHPLGFQASVPYAALFAQVAGAATSEMWARDGGSAAPDARDRLVGLAAHIHGLPARTSGDSQVTLATRNRAGLTEEIEWLAPHPLSDVLLEPVEAAALEFLSLLHQAPNPFGGDSVNLVPALTYLTGVGTAEIAIRAAARLEMSGGTAATAARMLLEEGAISTWRLGDASDDELRRRWVVVADDATHRRSALRQRLGAAGTEPEALDVLFYPLPGLGKAMDRMRQPANVRPERLPPVAEFLMAAGEGSPEPAWQELAYSLLSQVAHSTPLGAMHAAARPNPTSGPPVLSHEMTALVLDAACTGARSLLVPLAAVLCLNLGLPQPREWADELAHTAAKVHNHARMVHFLD